MNPKIGDILVDPTTGLRMEVTEVERGGRMVYISWYDLKHQVGPFRSPLKDLRRAGWTIENPYEDALGLLHDGESTGKNREEKRRRER